MAACDRAAPHKVDVSTEASTIAGEPTPAAVPAPFALSRQQSAPDERAEIREGRLRMRVGSVDSAASEAAALASALGGHTARRDVRLSESRARGGTIELRVPFDRFDEAIAQLATLGSVEHSSVSTVDVGDQIVDQRARLENARRLEARLLELLRTRTGNLQDVLAAERELARVREEIERIEARLAWLQQRVAMSSIALELFEPAPILALRPAGSVIAESFRAAWRNFIALLAALIASLGFVIPLVLVAGATVLAYRRWSGGRGGRAAPPAGGEAAAGGILGG